MNKQEALEALLAKLRTYESPFAEQPSVALPLPAALRELTAKCESVSRAVRNGTVPDERLLVEVGALVLYVLRDEVEVVMVKEPGCDMGEEECSCERPVVRGAST